MGVKEFIKYFIALFHVIRAFAPIYQTFVLGLTLNRTNKHVTIMFP